MTAPATSPGAARVLGLQRAAGNRAAAAVLAAPGMIRRQLDADRDAPASSPLRLEPPSLLQPRDRSSRYSLGDDRLVLDPELQASLDLLRRQLERENLRRLFVTIPTDAPASTSDPFRLSTAERPSVRGHAVRGPLGVEPTEPASLGDLLAAITATPEFASLSERASAEALARWNRAAPGERRITVTAAVALAGATLGGALASPAGRDTLAQLSGRPLTVPGVPGLKPEFNVVGGHVIVGLHVDVGAFLRGTGGFERARRGPIPLTPQTNR